MKAVKSRPLWVRAGSLQAARTILVLFVVTLALMALNISVGNRPRFTDSALVVFGALWAIAQWRWMEYDHRHVEDELARLLEDEQPRDTP